MGRSLNGAFGAGAISQGVFNLKAGDTIALNDLLEISLNGLAYPVQTTDYAAVSNVNYGTAQTSEATGLIVAQTQVTSQQTLAYDRQAVLRDDTDGSIFAFTMSITNTGCTLFKYSATGVLLNSVVVNAEASASADNKIFKLTNGDICVIEFANSGSKINFAIYDTDLNVIKALTALSEAVTNLFSSAIPLSSGGFAVVYQPSATPLLTRLVTYDNAGNVVLAPTTIWTRTGTTGVQYHKMAQLADGNLAFAISSANSVSSIGLYYGITSASGVSVKAFTSLDATGTQLTPELSVTSGHFAIAKANGTNQQAWVFNNAGTQQGGTFTSATTVGILLNKIKLVNDGESFWLIWARSADTKEVLTKIPTTGTGYRTTVITTSTTQYHFYIDAIYENGFIVGVSVSGGGTASPTMWVINTATGLLVGSAGTSFGVNAGSSTGQYLRVIPGTDFSFICMYDYVTTASTNICVGKYANTAIMGVAQGAAVAGSLAPTATPSGGYVCNALKGSATKSFDHSTANIYGNKGAMLTYGVTLKGM